MLSFAEEIYLLALDDVSGKITIPSKDIVLSTVLIGAVLCELAFLNRIDNDQEFLYLLSTESTGNPILDETLKTIQQTGQQKNTIYHCLKILLPEAKQIEQDVLEHLIKRGILKQVNEKIFWFFPSRRYPVIDNREIKDVETRLRETILTDAIPTPRDTVLISLAHTCDLLEEILSPREMRRFAERIEELAKLDLVGQEVAQLINQINAFRSMPPYI